MANAGGSMMRLADSGLTQLVDAALLEHFSPVAIVLTESLRVVEVRGNPARFGVRAILGRPLRGDAAVRIRSIAGNEPRTADFGPVRVTAIPLRGPEHEGEHLYCAIFEDRRVEHDLRVAHEQLSLLLDESEVTTEELRSTLEELRAANSELHHANYALSAANQEIERVNVKVEGRATELQRCNDEIGNMLGSLKMPIVLLGADLRIRRFTAHAARLFDLKASDVGKALTEVAAANGLGSLGEACVEVLARYTPAARELRHADGRALPVLVLPCLAGENQIEGVIVTASPPRFQQY